MKEEIKSLIDCMPGEILGRDVIDVKTGCVLCKAGHVLTEESIRWCRQFSCSTVYIRKSSWDHAWCLDEKTITQYSETKDKVRDVLKNLTNEKVLDTEALKEVRSAFKKDISSNTKILGCVNLVKSLDEYTHAHCMNVGMLSVLIGRWLQLSEDQLNELFLAGMLHDVGKYRVDPLVLNKRGKLSREEYGVAKKHVLYGYDLIKDASDITEDVKMGVLTHHERIDGTGYPRGLQEKDIPLYGKIVAIADVYDAMISKRVYKDRQMPFDVMEKMMIEGVGKLDTKVLLTFLNHIADYYVGTYVQLSTGDAGEVIFIHPHCVHRPIVQVGNQYINLETQKGIRIVDII